MRVRVIAADVTDRASIDRALGLAREKFVQTRLTDCCCKTCRLNAMKLFLMQIDVYVLQVDVELIQQQSIVHLNIVAINCNSLQMPLCRTTLVAADMYPILPCRPDKLRQFISDMAFGRAVDSASASSSEQKQS